MPAKPISAYAFVDDSCDVGTRSTSKAHFVLGGYFMTPADGPSVASGLAQARSEFGLPPGAVLHFANYQHEPRVRLAQVVGGMPITAFSVVLCKKAGGPKRPWSPDRLYNWMVRLSLERASWFFKRQGLYGSVTFEHLKGADVSKTHAYVRLLMDRQEPSIEWDALHLPVRFASKRTEERLQAADTVASGFGGAFDGFSLGVTEQRYVRELSPILWRDAGRLERYGLTLLPPLDRQNPCGHDDGHAWVKTFLT